MTQLREVLTSRKDEILAHQKQGNVITISEEISGQFHDLLTHIEQRDEKIDQIRSVVRDVFELQERDLVVFLNGKIVIRLFCPPQEGQRCERRFEGLPPEELEALKVKIFKNDETVVGELAVIVDSLMENELNFSRISNEWFSANYLKILQSAIHEWVGRFVKPDSGVKEPFGNYILRQHWKLIHEKMAQRIVDLLIDKDPNAMTFIKFYSGDVVMGVDKRRWRLPEIIDTENKKWNYSTILAIALQKRKNLDALKARDQVVREIQKSIAECDESIRKIEQERESLEAEREALLQEAATTETFISELEAALASLRSKLKASEGEARTELQKEINEKMILIKRTTIKEDEIYNQQKRLDAQFKLSESKIQKTQHLKNGYIKKLREENEKTAQLIKSQQDVDQKYEIMIAAVAKALTKKKVPV